MPASPRPTTNTARAAAAATAAAAVLRERLGWICCATGVLLCALGWYGVSGERYAARQIPYLASATAPGTALIVGGTLLLAARRRNARPSPEVDQMQRQLALLTHLLTEAAEAERAERAEQAGDNGGPDATDNLPWLLAVPGGRTYHRSDCLLVLGRQDPVRLLNGDAAVRGLRPCPLCEPPEGA
ncbi:hypothetical protein [Streptacidiphilus cavernicola]|uniref:Uncharacterized protein n=1 Tax=Streptacidiphilus cavernicola TaxID=3342716 RepID=A0ABV6W3Z5_9ACTN